MGTSYTETSTPSKTSRALRTRAFIGVAMVLVGVTGISLAFLAVLQSQRQNVAHIRCVLAAKKTALVADAQLQASATSMRQLLPSLKSVARTSRGVKALQRRAADVYNRIATTGSVPSDVLLTASERKSISDMSSGCAERPVVQQGTLIEQHRDNEALHTSRVTYVLKNSSGNMPLAFVGDAPPEDMIGATVEVHGLTLGNALLVNSTSGLTNPEAGYVKVVSPKETSEPSTGTPGGGQPAASTRILVLIAYPQSVPPPPHSVADATSEMFSTATGAKSVKQYYSEISYGAANLTGDVRGVFPLNVPATDCGVNQAAPALDAAHAADPTLDISSYQRLVLIWPSTANCGFEGFVSGVVVPVVRPYGTFSGIMATVFDQPDGFEKIAEHELGHTFAASHANFLSCSGLKDSAGHWVSIDARCKQMEYINFFDTMGFGLGHFTVYNKISAGYLSSGTNVKNVTAADMNASGYADYTIQNLETDSTPGVPGTGDLKGIALRRGQTEALYVEYRQPVGFDVGLPVASTTPCTNNVYAGVIITDDRYLLEANPPYTCVENYYDPALPVGVPFTDPLTKSQVTLLSKTSTSATVRVRVIPDTTAPTITQTAPSAGSFVGGQVYFGATAADNIGVADVSFYLDGATSPFYHVSGRTLIGTSVSATALGEGPHTIIAVAYDGAGNRTSTSPRSFTVDATPPLVQFMSPAANATLHGTAHIIIGGEDSLGLGNAELYLDGDTNVPVGYGVFDTSGECAQTLTGGHCLYDVPVNWTTTTVPNGTHTLMARVYNAAGLYSQTTLAVQVRN